MLVLFFASRDFPAVTLIFALPHKENFFFSNSNSIWNTILNILEFLGFFGNQIESHSTKLNSKIFLIGITNFILLN